MAAAPLVVLHVAPHPDDELVGAGATLMALRDEGDRIVNLACGLGRRDDRERRRREVERACAAAGFELRVVEPPPSLSRDDDLALAEERLVGEIAAHLADLRPGLVISPSPQDGHHGHEAVARATRRALEAADPPPRWWMWGYWADLPMPTLLVPFERARLDEVLAALAEHAGELARNDVVRAVEGRAAANAVLGAERVFGYGAAGDGRTAYAELLTEVVWAADEWWLGTTRRLDPARPFVDPGPQPLGWWLHQPSARAVLARAEWAAASV
jgi:LmbE family N-acetylglucosaminyl deacetylase